MSKVFSIIGLETNTGIRDCGLKFANEGKMEDLINILPGRVIINEISTWPIELVKIFAGNINMLKMYQAFEDEINEQSIENIMLRWHRPVNPYLDLWKTILSKVAVLLEPLLFVGFHCTRLTHEEISHIMTAGLQPLSTEFTIKRLQTLMSNNVINEKEYEYLKANNQSSAEYRRAIVWFFLNSNTLQDEFGLNRFFRCWGGEAIYWDNENKKTIAPKLMSIGVPCIVIVNLSYDMIHTFYGLLRVLQKMLMQQQGKQALILLILKI